MVKTLPSDAGGAGSIPDQGAKIPHALRPTLPKHLKNSIISERKMCYKGSRTKEGR